MQEQLKASQLEELLLQQEEQQRQLVKMNGSKDSTKGKNIYFFVLLKTCRIPINVSFQCCVVVFFSFLPDQWKVVENDQELSVNVSHFHEQDDTIIQSNVVKLLENTRRADKAHHDRYTLTVGRDAMESFCPIVTPNTLLQLCFAVTV